ncbi:S1C family serine protease [Falsiroseomonas oryzae]|uniref:S1C family serine protease n=1 Tax=Falsiroseomonas oryzae TaxID=2766473 RepID=UPI0022EA6E35|nr:S1C family serine protease [Roseomonas sp. MO-31]
MAEDDWTIPEELRPDPADYAFDLPAALGSVVALKSRVPADAFSARTLGTEREGSGVVIRADGLVLTIGYLVSEADSIWITTAGGRVVPGHALAFDFETGFGLVQALGRLETPAIPLGPETTPETGVQTVLAAAPQGGRDDEEGGAVACSIVAKEPFAGYWEYLLEEALFTAPAHPSWGGAALIGPDGKLIGIGSLVLQHRDKRGRRLDLNMCVPTTLLHPILNDLLSYGRVNKPARPWIGLYAADQEEGIVVASVASKGPAEKAGIRAGDRILGIDGAEAPDLAALWRSLWSRGSAGVSVQLQAERDGRKFSVPVASADRASFLKAPRLH